MLFKHVDDEIVNVFFDIITSNRFNQKIFIINYFDEIIKNILKFVFFFALNKFKYNLKNRSQI